MVVVTRYYQSWRRRRIDLIKSSVSWPERLKWERKGVWQGFCPYLFNLVQWRRVLRGHRRVLRLLGRRWREDWSRGKGVTREVMSVWLESLRSDVGVLKTWITRKTDFTKRGHVGVTGVFEVRCRNPGNMNYQGDGLY